MKASCKLIALFRSSLSKIGVSNPDSLENDFFMLPIYSKFEN